MVNDSGFEAMVATHHGEIYRYLLRATRRPSDADDLSQETFLRAYRAYRTLPKDANARAWLFAIATNLFRNHLRGQRRRRTAYAAVERMSTDADRMGPEGVTLGREIGARIERAVERLSAKQRLAFLMRKIHGLEYGAIGQSLECSAESARAHVFQALRKIRRALDGQPDDKEREP